VKEFRYPVYLEERFVIIHDSRGTVPTKRSPQSRDFLHKLSTKLIHESLRICTEDLQVEKMGKIHKLAKSSQMRDGSRIVGADDSEGRQKVPLLSVCSCCGYLNKKVKNLNLKGMRIPKLW
jgi:putative transposase